MSALEVRSPVPPTRSTADVVDQVLARARSGEPMTAAEADAREADALTPRTPPGAPALADLPVRAPPGPPKPAPAPPPPRPAAAVAAPASRPAAPTRPAASVAKPAAAAAAAPAPPATAAALINEDAPWLPPEPERRTAFLQVFRYWHKQVRPEYADKALPAFLFLVTALPVMVKARDDLKALNLWEPPGEHSRQARDQHPAWRKYCEFLPRAQQALQELDAYRHLSLLTALDDLTARITKAEKRFREGLPTARR